MLKIGITGQNGFIGKHLYNTLGLYAEVFEQVYFDRSYFEDDRQMDDFIGKCDVVVHLAGMNRHNTLQVIHDTNIDLTKRLIASLERCNSKAHVIFSSSTQEEKDNLYGQSKRTSRLLLAEWSQKNGGKFTALVIPNVYGPFGRPFYNSVIATFCYQVAHEEVAKIEIDGLLKLIYVGELIDFILKCIRDVKEADWLIVPHTTEVKVSDILKLLQYYYDKYQLQGIIPNIRSGFELHLFNTYRSYIDIKQHFPVKFKQHTDPRGTFVEVVKINTGGQVSFSITVPGVTRGNHFHTRKIERFAVIQGEALIQLRRIGTKEVLDFYLSGTSPAYVDMPVWYTHNIKNIGKEELLTIFWINEFYNPGDPDTYMEIV